jgi:hypothetical protein
MEEMEIIMQCYVGRIVVQSYAPEYQKASDTHT